MDWLKHSGLWVGFVLNPYHWQFKWVRNDSTVYENAVYCGPFWIRLIFDNGKW